MNSNRTESVSNNYLILLIIINCISFFNSDIFYIYNNLAFYGNLLSLLIIIFLRKNIKKRDFTKYVLLFIIAIYGFITIFVTHGGIGSVITISYSLLLIIVLNNSNFDNRKLKILLSMFLILNLYWVFNSKGYYTEALYSRGASINSNTIATIIMYTAIYISIITKKLKIKFSSCINFLIFTFSIWAIINCDSRGALITLIAFIFMDLILPKRIWKSKLRVVTIFVIIIIAGTVFPYIYTQVLYSNNITFTLPFTSKSLYTGREIIWGNYFVQMDQNSLNWLFGIGSYAELWSSKLNLHNNYLTVITNFGLIGYTLYYGFILKQISDLYKKRGISNYTISLIIGFISVFINGFIEVSALWHIMFFFNFLFLGLVSNEEKNACSN